MRLRWTVGKALSQYRPEMDHIKYRTMRNLLTVGDVAFAHAHPDIFT